MNKLDKYLPFPHFDSIIKRPSDNVVCTFFLIPSPGTAPDTVIMSCRQKSYQIYKLTYIFLINEINK